MGVLQFFVQWVALHALFDPRLHQERLRTTPRNSILPRWGQNGASPSGASNTVGIYELPPPPQLVEACNELVSQLLTLADDDSIEVYLPQFVSMIVEAGCGSPASAERVRNLELFLLDRCHRNPQLGLRFCWLLEAHIGRGEVIRQNPLLATPAQRRALALLRSYRQGTLLGDVDDPEALRAQRSCYIADFDAFVRMLTKMSFDLKTLTPAVRKVHFQALLETVNARLLRRIQSRGATMNIGSGSLSTSQSAAWFLECALVDDLGLTFDTSPPSMSPSDQEEAARRREEILSFALHLPGVGVGLPEGPVPLKREAQPGVRRVLRILPGESKILHSATRTPLLLVCETIPGEVSASGAELYCRPSLGLGLTLRDRLRGKEFPKGLLSEHRGLRPADFSPQGSNGSDRMRDSIGMERTPMAARGGMSMMDEDPSLAAFAALEPSITRVFGESQKSRENRVRKTSAFSRLPGWGLRSIIVKAGEDLRQEQLANQMLVLAQEAFAADNIPIRVHPYHIICTSSNAGIVEVVPDAVSIDQLKKRSEGGRDLRSIYIEAFGPPYSPTFTMAQMEFARSLAGYSILSYVLGVKDRHNANLLIDRYGRIIHIDYGFMLGNHPGAVMWETAPFKMSREYVDLLGGVGSPAFKEFERLLVQGMFSLRKRANAIVALLQLGLGTSFKGGVAVREVARRLGSLETERDVMALLAESIDNRRMKQYDWYQYYTNGIIP
mmetsp:Transcript_4105/g.15846  ORF Transcript_4105/g.15846 Transcript_4105/m.15846 type:complete len:725 (-) Transcript_4105:4537-6711(-)